jgi:Zn-dependent protease
MRKFTIGQVWGIPIRTNVGLLLLLPLLAFLIGTGEQITLYTGIVNEFSPQPIEVADVSGQPLRWVIGVFASVFLFVSVTLHELGHSYAARHYDIEIESITLWIFGGVANLERIPREWNREFWIALAGPVVSFGIAVCCYLLLQVVPASLPAVVFVIGWIGVANLVLVVFNIFPAFPMDGGRVFRAILSRTRPYTEATQIAARLGVAFAFVLAFFAAMSLSPILFLVAWFLYGAANDESRVSALSGLLADVTVADVMMADPEAIPAEASLGDFVELAVNSDQTAFPVAEDGEIVGFVTLEQVEQAREATNGETVRGIMYDSPVRVPATEEAFDTFLRFQDIEGDHVLVERDGEVVGVLSDDDLLDLMQTRMREGSTMATEVGAD